MSLEGAPSNPPPPEPHSGGPSSSPRPEAPPPPDNSIAPAEPRAEPGAEPLPAEKEASPSPEDLPLRPAWLPFTFGRVASFANASMDRLALVQLIMALAIGATVLRFVERRYAPVIAAAIQNMPEDAVLRNGVLVGATHGTLAVGEFLSLAVDLDEGPLGQVGDVQLELHRGYFAVCPMYRALAGVGELRYPPGEIPMGRTDLQARWEAWRPMLYAGLVAGVAAGLMLTWAVLAALYAIPARLGAFFSDRELGLGQCWKVASAALMPGAALMEAALLLYGARRADLIGLSILAAAHLVAGWIYLAGGVWRSPRKKLIAKTKEAPESAKPAQQEPSPFSAPPEPEPDADPAKTKDDDNPFRA